MLTIHNLKKSFINSANEKSDVINIREFHLKEAEQLAVTGESGAGKSTFLNLISGIVSADSGEIIFDGTDITKLSESKRDLFRAKNIGYIFQSFNLLQGFSSLENLMLGMMFAGKTDKKKCEDALSKVGLSDKLKSKPAELSVGEQQRVAVARAIVNSPKLILADEPTANLDKKNSDSVIGLIKNLCTENKIALIIVSHDKDVIANFLNKKDFDAINSL
ncbi:MAG: ABC transporter ATP-binding protein, partial [Ignavibacteria bacterium]|nr:ABC transporter ATP-binding protein [Ignavibacteria bacterium]